MKQQIDIDQIMAHQLPTSLRDRKITSLGIASFIFYALAAFCAWQFGGWWGIGLVVSIFVIDTSDDFVHEEHRHELIELHVIPGMDHHFSIFDSAEAAFEDETGIANASPFLDEFLRWLRTVTAN